MADVYTSADASALLKDKYIVFIGGSNMRALYKDFLWLLKDNSLININCLRRKLERNYLGDSLVRSTSLTKSRDFYEERIFEGSQNYLRFFFVTRCYCETLIKFMTRIKERECHAPDVIIMNSCLWDINRWGPYGVEEYKVNMVKLMKLLNSSLPPWTLFIWTTALPVSTTIRGGLLIKQIEFMERSARFHIMEANLFTRDLVNSYGFDIVDLHYHVQYQISRRSSDGVHYLPLPVRLQTNILLTHIALSWERELPRLGDVMFVDEEIDLALSKSNDDYWTECYNSSFPDLRGKVPFEGSNNQAQSYPYNTYPVEQSKEEKSTPSLRKKARASREPARNNRRMRKIPKMSLSPYPNLRSPGRRKSPRSKPVPYHPDNKSTLRPSRDQQKKEQGKPSAKYNSKSVKSPKKKNQRKTELKTTFITGTSLIVTVPVSEAIPEDTFQTRTERITPQSRRKNRSRGTTNLKRLQRSAYSTAANRRAISTRGNAVRAFLKSAKKH